MSYVDYIKMMVKKDEKIIRFPIERTFRSSAAVAQVPVKHLVASSNLASGAKHCERDNLPA